MARVTLERWTVFQCAHFLPRMPAGHKCRNEHGHTYKLTIACEGPVGDDGLVFDNAAIDDVLAVVRAQLDHRHLNKLSLAFSDNPTAERMLQWLWRLASEDPVVGPALSRMELEEGDRSKFVMVRDSAGFPFPGADAR